MMKEKDLEMIIDGKEVIIKDGERLLKKIVKTITKELIQSQELQSEEKSQSKKDEDWQAWQEQFDYDYNRINEEIRRIEERW